MQLHPSPRPVFMYVCIRLYTHIYIQTSTTYFIM